MPPAARRNPFSLAFNYLSTKARRTSSINTSQPKRSSIAASSTTASPTATKQFSKMAPSNQAAFIDEPKKHPMTVGPSPYPSAGNGEIVVKVAATAINPMDWYIQLLGNDLFNFLQYPYVGGSDVAGTVAEVGAGVTNFKVGDRVIGLCAGFDQKAGGFQNYVVIESKIAAQIPADLSFTDASVLPLGLSTAACGLYQKDFLGLDPPSLNPKPNGKTVLIWAGASSVGSNAVQLAAASGYEVFTTSSPKNFDLCKSLGASQVFDYNSPTVAQDIIAAFQGKKCAGGYAICQGSEKHVFEIIGKAEGSNFIAAAMPVPNVPAGVESKMVFGSTLKDNEVGPIVWGQFLPAALAQKKFKIAPKPLVAGHGLEAIQAAIDQGKAPGSISAQKLVITL